MPPRLGALQSSIAYFLVNKDNIKSLFSETGLTRNTLEHPFLFKVNLDKCTGVLHFYHDYLKAKEKYLTDAISFIEGIKGDKKSNKNIPPAKKNDIIAKYGHILAIDERQAIERNYENVPTLLPKGLFNEAIANAINAPQREGFKGDMSNPVFGLAHLLKGDTQPFYETDYETKAFTHYYPKLKNAEHIMYNAANTEGERVEKTSLMTTLETELDKLYELKRAKSFKKKTNEEKDEIKFKLRDANKLKDYILETEQTIRYHQANDRALWLIIQDLSAYRAKIDDKSGAFIDFTTDELSLKGINLSDNPIVLESTGKKVKNILDMPVKMSLTINSKTIYDELEIKRYGDFRRILKDRRIADLVSYFEEKDLHYIRIKEELERYDLRREDFLKLILDFEKIVHLSLKDKFPVMNNGFYDHESFMAARGKSVKPYDKRRDYYDHEICIYIYVESNRLDINHYVENVVKLRNKFLHNEFPDLPWLHSIIKNEKKSYITDRVFDIAERQYRNLLKDTDLA